MGIFELRNHGIPLYVLNEADNEIKRLFALPIEQKLKALRRAGTFAGYGSSILSSSFPKSMWHEQFSIIDSSYDDQAKKVFPDRDLARFSGTIEEFQKQLEKVTEKVTGIILELLGVCDDEQKKWVKCSENVTLQMNHYPSCLDPDRAMGLFEHKDTTILTLLRKTQDETQTEAEDQTSGLQIFKEGIGWVPVRLDPDAIAVQLGDFLEILSNGRFTSPLHRARVSRKNHRYSFAFFHKPSLDVLLSPFHSPPRFRTLTFKEYLHVKAKDRPNALPSISI